MFFSEEEEEDFPKSPTSIVVSPGKQPRRRRRASLDSSSRHNNSNSVDYHSDSEAVKMLDEMQYFREKKFFCDVTIIVGSREFEVSWVISNQNHI